MPLTRNQTNAAAQAKNSGGAEAAETSTSKDTGEQGGTSSETDPPRRESPDNCSICLGPFINKSFTNSCAHSFCFVCLKQWSKVKAECPLCKQPFCRIFHNIRSSQLYDTYELPRQPPSQVNQFNIYDYVGGGLTTFTAPTHHYLSLPQPFDADLTLSNFSRFQFRHRRYDRYLNPLSIQGEHPYSFTHPAVNPTTHISAASWPRGPEDFRREVYRRNLGPLVVILGYENSTYRLTPAMVQASSHRLHRIMPWLTRELRVLLRSHQNVRLAVSMIQPLLTQVSIDSVYFHDRVAILIGRRSRVFVQEFLAFANSALSMQAFDRKAMYQRCDESVAASSPSSTSSENDVVEITDISPDPVVASSFAETQTSSLQPLDLRRSGWDSPTPGPSWSGWGARDISVPAVQIDRVSVSSESDDPIFIPNLRESDSEKSRAGSDIIFLKYDKPWEERSPIKLTSDSEKEAEAERVKKKKKNKHKKRRKVSTEKVHAAKKDKSQKSSKGKTHGKEKSKSSLKGESGEDQSEDTHKRHFSCSSSETHKVKRRKKSKDKREKSSDPNNDRELIDRLFAEAFAQQQKRNASAAEEKKEDSPKCSKVKARSGRSSTKDRSKKKKKRKNHSRDSVSPSYSQSFKKHPSGHKKSSNAAHLSQSSSSERNRSHHNRLSVDGDKGPVTPSHASRRASFDVDRDPVNHPHSSSAMAHSVTAGFQPPYLPHPETVQHIPVNLWVSTWPAIPVSHSTHTYHTQHPQTHSSNPPGSSHTITANSNTSFPAAVSTAAVSTASIPGTSTAAVDSHTISSDSSSAEYDSDDAHDRQIPSLKNVDSRTMHWLETHCPNLGRLQPGTSPVMETQNAPVSPAAKSSSSSSSSSSSLSSSDSDVSEDNVQQPKPLEPVEPAVKILDYYSEDVNVEVVSVGSGDEDIVVCSSASQSDSDDVHCLDEEPAPVNSCAVAAAAALAADLTSNLGSEIVFPPIDINMIGGTESSMSTMPFLSDFSHPQIETSTTSNLFLPSGNKTFQPFKLPRKSALTQQGNDPFFPPMLHSSDEDDENSGKTEPPLPHNSHVKEVNATPLQTSQNSTASKAKTTSFFDLLQDKVPATSTVIVNVENVTDVHDASDKARIVSDGSELWKSNSNRNTEQSSAIQTSGNIQSSYSAPSTFSKATPSMFSVLPSLPQSNSNPTATTVLPSSLNYLPYSSPLPSPASLPTTFSGAIPQGISPSATVQAPNLALQFPISTQSQTHNGMLSSIHLSVTHQDSPNETFASSEHAMATTSDKDACLFLPSESVESNSGLPKLAHALAVVYADRAENNDISNSTSVGNTGKSCMVDNNLYEKRHLDDCEIDTAVNSVNENESLHDLKDSNSISKNHLEISAQKDNEGSLPSNETKEQVGSDLPNFTNCSAATSDAFGIHDYLDPEENAFVQEKRDERLVDTDSHFHNLVASLELDSSVTDKVSNSDDRSSNFETQSMYVSDNKSTESFPNVLFDSNSVSSRPFSECSLGDQDSRSLEPVTPSNVPESTEKDIEAR